MTIEAWRAAASSLEAWDGRLESAQAAVDAVLALEPLKARPDPSDAALLKQLGAFRRLGGKAPGHDAFPRAHGSRGCAAGTGMTPHPRPWLTDSRSASTTATPLLVMFPPAAPAGGISFESMKIALNKSAEATGCPRPDGTAASTEVESMMLPSLVPPTTAPAAPGRAERAITARLFVTSEVAAATVFYVVKTAVRAGHERIEMAPLESGTDRRGAIRFVLEPLPKVPPATPPVREHDVGLTILVSPPGLDMDAGGRPISTFIKVPGSDARPLIPVEADGKQDLAALS
jgi:hypothetical protein